MQIFPLIDPYSVHFDTYAGNLYTLSTDSVTLTAGTLTAANLVTAGDLTLGQYIYHQGDLNTYIRFTDDRIDFYVRDVQAYYTYWTGVLNIIETHFAYAILKIDTTTYLQCDGASFFDGQAIFTSTPTDTSASGASLYVNPASATNNYALFGVALNGSDRFLIDEDGDIGIYSGWIYRLGDSNTSIDWYAADSWKLTVGGTDMAVFVENTTSSTIKFYGITSIGDGGTTNYSKFAINGDMSFVGTAGFYPRFLTQTDEPAAGTGATQCDTSELVVWKDSDDSKVYLCFNDGGTIKTVELA